MARILATWELGCGYGHVANVAPLASALALGGHQTIFAARDPVAAHDVAGGAFAGIVQAPIYMRRLARRDTLTYGQVIADGGFVDLSSVAALVRAWLALFDMVGPDALLVEHAPVSALAAHVACIRAVRVGPTFTAPRASDPMPTLMPWATHRPAELAEAGRTADAIVHGICRMFGARPLSGLAELLSRTPDFALTWPEVDHHGPQPDIGYYGPLTGITATARPDWPLADGPRTLVYLRFDRPAGRTVAEALGMLGWPVIWHSTARPGFMLPSNIQHAPEPVDMAGVAADARLFVGRGGHGTGCAMLRAGLPQLLLPDTLESLLVTYRLRAVGAAMSQSGSAGSDEIHHALRRIAGDDHIRSATRRHRDAYASYDAVLATELLADDVAATLRIARPRIDNRSFPDGKLHRCVKLNH
jgi:UDP:flavonoid glycosyltransferase YjiC (YdhE family)